MYSSTKTICGGAQPGVNTARIVTTDLEQTNHLVRANVRHVPSEASINHFANVSCQQQLNSGSLLMRLATMLHVVRI